MAAGCRRNTSRARRTGEGLLDLRHRAAGDQLAVGAAGAAVGSAAGEDPVLTVLPVGVQTGQVKSISSKADTISGTFTTKVRYPPGDAKATPTTLFSTQVPAFWNNNALTALLQQHNVQVNAQNPNPGTSLLAEILLGFGPTLLLVGLFVLLARRAQAGAGGLGGLGNFGRSQARRVDPEKIRVTFDDVAGIDEAKARADRDRRLPRRRRTGIGASAGGFLMACCCSARRAPVRRCSPGRWRARLARRSSRSPPRSSSRRSSASARPGCETCSPRPRRRRLRSSSSTSSTRSAARARGQPGSPAPTTSASRRSIRS